MKKTTVKAISHAKENLSIVIEGKDIDVIIAEVQTHEGVKAPGKVSLKEMIAGTKTKVGDWEVIDLDPTPEPTKAKSEAAAAAKANADADKIKPDADKPVADKPADDTKAPTTAKVKTLTPEQAKLAADAEKALPTKETKPVVEKAPRQLKDVSHLLPTPGEYRSLKETSRTFQLFQDMCRPEGITKKEACEKYKWTDGGWGGIIHWEPKHKGYQLGTVKGADGVVHYHLMWHKDDQAEGRAGGNVKVKAEQVFKAEAKPEVVKKTDEQKAAEKAEKQAKKDAEAKEKADKKAQAAADKAAAAAAKPAPAPKAAADAPQGGGNVTRRSRKTKDAAPAAPAA